MDVRAEVNEPVRGWAFYGGVLLITASTLMLQLIETRIYSAVTWYQLAFFCISIAMFGLTAGAVWVFLQGERFSEATLSHDLAYFSAAFAVTTPLSLIIQTTLAPDFALSLSALIVWAELAVFMSIPFFFSGVVVSLALTRSPFPIGRVYGVDLFGAAIGCLGVLLLLNSTDGPSAVLWVGVSAAAGAILFARSGIGGEPASPPPFSSYLSQRSRVLIALVALAVLNGLTVHGIQPMFVKGKIDRRGLGRFEQWNSFSRIEASRSRVDTPLLWGASRIPDELRIEQRMLSIDGGAGTAMYNFGGDLQAAEFLKLDVTNLAYFLPDRERAAVIGVGGGRDILSARIFGVPDVTGVEINPIFIGLLRDRFRDFAGLYGLEGVRFEVDEARSWFARSREEFDVIQMSLIDTWAATGAGAYTLSENGLYTVEAWKIFLSRLSADGVFTVSRWYAPDELNETGRMISLALAALIDLGAEDPRQHIFVASDTRPPDAVANLVLSRSPLPPAYLEALEQATAEYGHQVLVSPRSEPASPIIARLVGTKSKAELIALAADPDLDLDLVPPDDDRPFFFNQVPFNKPRQIYRLLTEPRGAGVAKGNLVAAGTLLSILVVSLALVLATIVVPLRPAVEDVGRRLALNGTAYFLCIGLGFMFVEIGLLQRMSVFLGHPIYSLSVVLFALILTTGLGSLASDRLAFDRPFKFVVWALLLGGYLLAISAYLSGILLDFDGETLPVRAALCVGIISPAGFLMGFGFPLGMRVVSTIDRTPTPWFWGINGAAGVLASGVAVASSITFGIDATLRFGAICYLLLIPLALAMASGIWEKLGPEQA